MALISIIIPAYNVAGYIEACLDSILAQTFADFEVITINDGSSDDTGIILNEYAGRDARIQVLHKKNGGVSAARNDGIKAAQGKYYLFFDADDFAEPYTFAELAKLMQRQKPDVLIYGYHRWRDGKVTQTCLPVFPEGAYEGESIITGLLSRFVGFSNEGINKWIRGEKNGLYVENPALWRCIINAELIRANRLAFDTSLKVGEDTVFISDLLSCASRCYVLHRCYYYLVYRESSVIATYEKDALKKLYGKRQLVIARNALTDRVLKRSGINIKEYWQGNIIMNSIELALLFAKKEDGLSFMQRYHSYLSYANLAEVRFAVASFKLRTKVSIKIIPFLMLKWRWHFLLFMCASVLNLMKYEFSRE